MYKLVAIDLDGTLLNDDKNISAHNYNILQEIIAKGIKVVIATGRTYTAAKQYHNTLKLDTPIISCNGGYIYNPKTQRVLSGTEISKFKVDKILKVLKKHEVFFQFYTAKSIYAKELKYLVENWNERNKILSDEDKINIELIDVKENFLQNINDPIYKFLAIEKDKEKYEAIIKDLNEIADLEIVSSFSGAIDIMTSGISKGNAVEEVCKYYNIDLEESIGIGDNNNDISMLLKAGLGIAMKNGTELAKKSASVIAEENTDDGVGKILEYYLL